MINIGQHISFLFMAYHTERPHISFLSFIILLLVHLSSCTRTNTIDVSYSAFYKVASFSLRGTTIIPQCIYDEETDASSRYFYNSLDSLLVFQKNRSYTHWEHNDVCAVDWRITKMDIIALEDYDSSHPAGSSLNELFTLEFWYKSKRVSLPIIEVRYGALMLSDYYPYDIDFSNLYLRPTDDLAPLSSIKIKVVIQDAFGRTIEADNNGLAIDNSVS